MYTLLGVASEVFVFVIKGLYESFIDEWQIYAKMWWIVLIEFGNEWTFNQLDGFKQVFNCVKPQNSKQMMDTIDSLSHAPKSKVIKSK
jgi:hypothetical protein